MHSANHSYRPSRSHWLTVWVNWFLLKTYSLKIEFCLVRPEQVLIQCLFKTRLKSWKRWIDRFGLNFESIGRLLVPECKHCQYSLYLNWRIKKKIKTRRSFLATTIQSNRINQIPCVAFIAYVSLIQEHDLFVSFMPQPLPLPLNRLYARYAIVN